MSSKYILNLRGFDQEPPNLRQFLSFSCARLFISSEIVFLSTSPRFTLLSITQWSRLQQFSQLYELCPDKLLLVMMLLLLLRLLFVVVMTSFLKWYSAMT